MLKKYMFYLVPGLIMIFINAFILHGKASNNLDTVSPKPTATPGLDTSYYQIISLLDTKYFDLKSAFTQAPPDIVEHLYYLGGGHGGGGPFCDTANKQDQKIWFPYSSDKVLELSQTEKLIVCGWEIGETVDIVITYPDGSKVNEKQKVYQDYATDFGEVTNYFETSLMDIPGVYSITYKGTQDEISTDIEVVKPTVPRLYFFDDQLVFVNYPPKEIVRLFAYDNDNLGYAEHCSLQGWQEYITDSEGYLVVQVPDRNYLFSYFAVSENTGILEPNLEGNVVQTCGANFYCAGAINPLNDIKANSIVEVVSQKALTNPSSSVKKNNILRIRYGPFCDNELFWWEADCISGCTDNSFLIAEGSKDEYFIELVTDSEVSQRQPYRPIAGCAPSRLYLGDAIMVEEKAEYITIRSTPDTHPTDNRIGRFEIGEVAQIVDGPICNYGWLLWEIDNSDGIHGWIPETNGEEFWLVAIDQ